MFLCAKPLQCSYTESKPSTASIISLSDKVLRDKVWSELKGGILLVSFQDQV